MELIGIILAAPLMLIASVVYTLLASLVLRRWPLVKQPVLYSSSGVIALTVIEIASILLFGAPSLYFYLHHFFTAWHFLVLLLTPPAIANLALILLEAKILRKWLHVSFASGCCWLACVVMLLGHIMIDEAIMGPDNHRPFYALSHKHPGPVFGTGGGLRAPEPLVSIESMTFVKGSGLPLDIPLPPFPWEMIRAGIEGSVIVRLKVDPDGLVKEATILESSQQEFEALTYSTLSRWKFIETPPPGSSERLGMIVDCRIKFGFDEN